MSMGRRDSPDEKAVKHGFIATTVKGAFKIYLLPAMRTRAAVAALAGGWSDLIAEARQDYEARTAAGVPVEHENDGGAAAAQPSTPAAEAMERHHPESPSPITPGSARMKRASGAKRKRVEARASATRAAEPSLTGPAQSDSAEPPASPTLVEAGESRVEVQPNPAISPAHVTSGVVAHVPPEVRHKLAGDGPIRA